MQFQRSVYKLVDVQRFQIPINDDLGLSALSFGAQDANVAMVFLHAVGMNAQAYSQLFEPVLEHRVIAIDIRGHGKSNLPTDDYNRAKWPALAEDIITACDELNLKAIVFAGHSMGATLSLLIAEKRPDLVKELLLIEPVILPRYFNILAHIPILTLLSYTNSYVRKALARQDQFQSTDEALKLWRKRTLFKSWQDGFLENYAKGGLKTENGSVKLSCSPKWEVACFRQMQYWPRRALKRAQCPITILHASTRSTFSMGAQKLISKKLPEIEVIKIADTGHFLPMEKPEVIKQSIDSRLAKSDLG